MRTRAVLALVLGLVAIATPARAEDEAAEAPPPSPSRWRFEALPYAWVPGQFGSVDVKGRTVDVAVSPKDSLDLVTAGNAFAVAGYFSLAYDRLSVFVDSFGGYAEVPIHERIPTALCCTISVEGRSKLKYVVNDAAIGWELGRWTLPHRERPLTLGVYAGARSMWFLVKVAANAGVVKGVRQAANATDSFAWSDPILGVQWSAPLLDPVSLDFRADIGGFGASSDLVWGISSAFKIWLPWRPFDVRPYGALGYRVVDFDRSSGSDRITLAFRGPTAGLGFAF